MTIEVRVTFQQYRHTAQTGIQSVRIIKNLGGLGSSLAGAMGA